MVPSSLPPQSLNVLMAASVSKRREGGVAAIIYNLGSELELRGHRVSYLFFEDLILPSSVPARFAELIFSLRLARYVADRRRDFSIANLHAPAGFSYGLRRRWGRSAGYPPYVMMLHGLEERRIYAMSREAKKGQAWNYSWKNRLWHRFYHQPRFRWSIRTADAIHTHCRDVWSFLQLKYNLDVDRVAYIPSGVEPRFFISRQYPSGAALKLLYAGTWLDQRGIFYLRAALRNLVVKIPGLTLTIAGGGAKDEEILSFFGAQLAPQIILRPIIPSADMPQLYADHDALVFPSLMEGLPSVLLEAMATGMPVITTETCGMTDIVEHDVDGLLIQPASSEAIEQAVSYLASSVEVRHRLGMAAREKMRRYTWERSAEMLERLYFYVLAKEGRSRG